jgi:hypothetical protein
VDAVAADQHVGFDMRSRLAAGAVPKMGQHAARILFEAREMVPRVHALGAEAVEHRAMEQAEERASMNGNL